MSLPNDREEAKQRVRDLVEAYARNANTYESNSGGYNETQARTDFVSPFLEALGWDVYNQKRLPLDLREVFEEATVEVGEEKLAKKPDYELRLARQRKLFVEAKKPSVDVTREKAPAFQTRRYGFSASLPVSVLTNFRSLVIFDCVPVPKEEHEANVARISVIPYTEYVDRFDEIYELISREFVYSGAFDEKFDVGVSRQGSEQFDDLFLKQVRSWRLRLAQDLHAQNPSLTSEELTFFVQRFLSRLVFLRICEDREIEKYGTLQEVDEQDTYASLTEILKNADKFYDSGLFRLLDDQPFNATFSNEVLKEVINELYYPLSPYTFSVVEASVLGEIYELFLSEVIEFDENGSISVVEKPEVRESGGVYTTPGFVVDAIVERTLGPVLQDKAPHDLKGVTVADICCGSGVFLLGAYEQLLNYYLDWHVSQKDLSEQSRKCIYEVAGDKWRLTLAAKRDVLLEHIRGVDIDANAVEVARFSLCLKLIENESKESLAAFVRESGETVLPSLANSVKVGNSLITHGEIARDERYSGNPEAFFPFSWDEEFATEFQQGGFDAIVGNPPYIRIQKMVAYAPDEVAFFQGEFSPYATASGDNFDKYALFIERSLELAKESGHVGLIVPHKFMTTTAGRAVQELVGTSRRISHIVHFGAIPVFGRQISNYTCILGLVKGEVDSFPLERVKELSAWRYGNPGEVQTIETSDLGTCGWSLASASASEVFKKVRSECPNKLEDVAEIFVGVQTSKDEVYIVKAKSEDANSILIEWNGRDWRLEKSGLRPFLQDVQLRAYDKPEPNSFIIFPYVIEGKKARLIQPDVMEAEMPGILDYLTARQSELADRSVSGGAKTERQFYQYGRTQSLSKFNSPKIILPILSLEPRYAFDDDNTVVTGGGNGPYYLIRPKDGDLSTLRYHLAVLCHSLPEAMIRSKTSVFRGGYYSHGKQFIKDLPVPDVEDSEKNAIAQLVTEVTEAFKELRTLRLPAQRQRKEQEIERLKGQIETRITTLYGMKDEELEAVKSVPVPD